MLCIYSVFVVSKKDKSKYFKDVQPENAPLISITFDVINLLEKLINFKDMQF